MLKELQHLYLVHSSSACLICLCICPLIRWSVFYQDINLVIFACSNVEIAVTSDGKTIVCYHPTVDIPYELTQVSEGFYSLINVILILIKELKEKYVSVTTLQ